MRKTILKESGTLKAKVSFDRYGAEFNLTRNGYQWTGQLISPELANLTIEVLQEYLQEKGNE